METYPYKYLQTHILIAEIIQMANNSLITNYDLFIQWNTTKQ